MLQDVSSKPIRDTVDDFVEGLKHFDKEGNGLISAVELRHLLTGLGEKMSEEEVESLIHGKEDSQVRYNLVFLGFNFNLIDRCGGRKARHEVYLWFPPPPRTLPQCFLIELQIVFRIVALYCIMILICIHQQIFSFIDKFLVKVMLGR